MFESGSVIKANSKKATVRIMKREQCAGCNACGMWGNHIDLIIDNSVECQKGDVVEIELKNNSDKMFAFIAYVIPLIFLAAGLAIGVLTKIHELYIVLIAFVMLIAGFAVAFVVDKKWVKSKKLNPVIIKIIQEENKNG